MIMLTHNLESKRFLWLWAKYVRGVNLDQHCTNSIHGVYSKVFSKHNSACLPGVPLSFNEQPIGSFKAIYICGVSQTGYAKKLNYPHNVHAAIFPFEGASDQWEFEGWRLGVTNGRFSHIPSLDELPDRYRDRPPAFTTCRIFRWAACQLDLGTL
jgi:hypothetical protein